MRVLFRDKLLLGLGMSYLILGDIFLITSMISLWRGVTNRKIYKGRGIHWGMRNLIDLINADTWNVASIDISDDNSQFYLNVLDESTQYKNI